ncbi:hypothetical protein S245_024527, partial [Arachis hypogaea]
MQKELQELKLQYKKLKIEHSLFHDIADKMIEEKDNEISRFSDDNRNLRQSLQSRPQVDHSDNDNYNTASHEVDSMNLSPSAAEQQILTIGSKRRRTSTITAPYLSSSKEIEELELRESSPQPTAILKAELRDMERSKKRKGVDMTYLKNVILKLLETGEVEVLLPVIGMLLQFSPQE